MGGSSDDTFLDSRDDTQREDIATLLAQFDPEANSRYTKVVRRVHLRPPLSPFRKGKKTETYPVAWSNQVSASGLLNDPPSVQLHTKLEPSVWITRDRQLLQHDLAIGDWTVITLGKVPNWRYRSLQLGLRGDFETIDREFEAMRQELAASTVDKIVRYLNRRDGNTLAAILLQPRIDTSTADYVARRQQCIDVLLDGKTLSN